MRKKNGRGNSIQNQKRRKKRDKSKRNKRKVTIEKTKTKETIEKTKTKETKGIEQRNKRATNEQKTYFDKGGSFPVGVPIIDNFAPKTPSFVFS